MKRGVNGLYFCSLILCLMDECLCLILVDETLADFLCLLASLLSILCLNFIAFGGLFVFC